MPVLTKGNLTLNLGIACISTEISEEDRQCAWELYCELVSRVALMGKENAHGELVFTGELYDQSLDSIYAFFSGGVRIDASLPGRTDQIGERAESSRVLHCRFVGGGDSALSGEMAGQLSALVAPGM